MLLACGLPNTLPLLVLACCCAPHPWQAGSLRYLRVAQEGSCRPCYVHGVLPLALVCICGRLRAQAGQLVAQYIYHCAWNAVFRVLGPLLHRTAGVPPAIAAGDGSVGGSAARMGSSLARSSSRRQLANM